MVALLDVYKISVFRSEILYHSNSLLGNFWSTSKFSMGSDGFAPAMVSVFGLDGGVAYILGGS